MILTKKDPRKLASIVIDIESGSSDKMDEKAPSMGQVMAIEAMFQAINEQNAEAFHQALCDWKDMAYEAE